MSNGWGSGRRGGRSSSRRFRSRSDTLGDGGGTSKIDGGDGGEHYRRSWSSSIRRRRNRPARDDNHESRAVVSTESSTRTMTTMTSSSSSSTTAKEHRNHHHHHEHLMHRGHRHLSNPSPMSTEAEERARRGTSMTEVGGRSFRSSCITKTSREMLDLPHRPSPSSVRTAMLDGPGGVGGSDTLSANCVDEPRACGRGHGRDDHGQHHHDGKHGDRHVDIGEVDAPEFAYRDHRHNRGGVDVDYDSDGVASYDSCGSSFPDIDDDSSADGDEVATTPGRIATNELLTLVTDRRWDMAVRRAASHPEEIMARGRHVRIGGDSIGGRGAPTAGQGHSSRSRRDGEHVPTLPLHAACTLDPPLSVVRALLGGPAASDDDLEVGAAAASAVDRDGRTSLHWACDAGGCSPDVVKEVLMANPQAATVQERTYGFLPLHIACFRDGHGEEDHGGEHDNDEVEQDCGGELDATGDVKELARSQSSSSRRAAEVADALLDVHPEGASVADDVMGWLPLHVVCRTDVRGADVARSLLRVHPNAAMVRDRGSRLPLHWACCHRFDRYRRRRRPGGETETADARGGAGEGVLDDSSDETKRDIAFGVDDIDEEHDPAAELVRAVLESCPESSRKRERHYGFLPLHIACSSGASTQVVSALLSTYPEAARTRDRNGSLPLHLACRADASEPVLNLLLRAFPDGAHFKDADSRLPLHWACQVGASSSKIEALLDAFEEGAQLTEAKYGYLPLHVACKRGAGPDVVAALLAAFPEASRTRDDCGNLPIHIACGTLAERGGGDGGGFNDDSRYRGVTEGVVGMLLLAFPESLEREDQQGRTPRMLAMDAFYEDHHHGDHSDFEAEEEGGHRRRPTLGGGGDCGGSRDSIIRMLSSEPSRWRRDLCSSSSLTSLVEAAASAGRDGHLAPLDKEEDCTAVEDRHLAFLSSSIGAEKSSRLEHDLLAALQRHEDDMRNNLLCSSTVDTGDEHDEDDHDRGYGYHHHGGRHQDHHHHHQIRHLSASCSGDGELKYLDVESSWGSPSSPPMPLMLTPQDHGEAVGDHEDHMGVAGWGTNNDDDKEHYDHHQIVVEVDDFYQGAASESGNGLTGMSARGDEWASGNAAEGMGDDNGVVAEQGQGSVMCVLCLERPVSYILYPCGHPCLCETCARLHLSSLRNVCPVGRCNFRDAVRVYGRIVGSQ